MTTVLPLWRVCCDADCDWTTLRGVCPPAAFAAPTFDQGREVRCEGEATHPGAPGAAHSPLFSL